MEKLVLLVDDDKLPMQFYVKALEEKGFKVRHCLEPGSALEFVGEKGSQIDAIILDIMMPPGDRYEHEHTNEGLRTGVFLLPDLRKYCPNIPVVVLTNVRNPDTLGLFKGKALVEVIQKKDCPPFELAELVDEMVGKSEEKPDSRERQG